MITTNYMISYGPSYFSIKDIANIPEFVQFYLTYFAAHPKTQFKEMTPKTLSYNMTSLNKKY